MKRHYPRLVGFNGPLTQINVALVSRLNSYCTHVEKTGCTERIVHIALPLQCFVPIRAYSRKNSRFEMSNGRRSSQGNPVSRRESVGGGNEFYISSERPTKSTLVATFRFLGNSVCVLFLLERIVNLFARGEIVEAASSVWQIVSII